MILCLNAATGGLTEWDLDWLGVAGHEGVVYGVTAGALIALDGTSEEVIDGQIRTGELDFSTPHEKRVPKAYFEIELGADATLTTGVAARGAITEYDYTLPLRDTDATTNGAYRRVNLARGNRGPWWAFELTGASWELGALEARVEIVSRRF